MTTLLPKERAALIESINAALGSLRNHSDERHHLLNTLGFVTSAINEAKTATTLGVLQSQIDILSVEIANLQKRGQIG